MADWERRGRLRQSNWAELRVLVSIAAIGLAVSGIVIYATNHAGLTDEPYASRLCEEADRARVAELVDILGRNRPTDAPVLERAVYALNVARRHCAYGWSDIAGEQYAWLHQWLDDHK